MITQTRQGTREICGARWRPRPESPWDLICDGEPYHLPPTPNGPAVHIAHDAGGEQLAAWTDNAGVVVAGLRRTVGGN